MRAVWRVFLPSLPGPRLVPVKMRISIKTVPPGDDTDVFAASENRLLMLESDTWVMAHMGQWHLDLVLEITAFTHLTHVHVSCSHMHSTWTCSPTTNLANRDNRSCYSSSDPMHRCVNCEEC